MFSKQILGNSILVAGYDYMCTLRKDLCHILFDCPPCPTTSVATQSTTSVATQSTTSAATQSITTTTTNVINKSIIVNPEDEISQIEEEEVIGFGAKTMRPTTVTDAILLVEDPFKVIVCQMIIQNLVYFQIC